MLMDVLIYKRYIHSDTHTYVLSKDCMHAYGRVDILGGIILCALIGFLMCFYVHVHIHIHTYICMYTYIYEWMSLS